MATKPLNKHLADINEILLGYHCAGKKFNLYGNQAKEVQGYLKKLKQLVGDEAYEIQDGRAQAQAEMSLKWASQNGYKLPVKRVFWTAKPGQLAAAVGQDVDSRNNPTDVLLQFSDDGFLGLSAKSTKSKGDIGFKNPGIGSLSSSLGIDLKSVAAKPIIASIKKLGLANAKGAKDRKLIYKQMLAQKGKESPEVQKFHSAGLLVLRKLRDALYDHYLDIDLDDLKEHFLEQWIDAKDRYPYYIKVTGRGSKGNYSAAVADPTKDEKTKKISSGDILLQKVGETSIGVWASDNGDEVRLFKIRFKWESAPFGSSIKLSGDPF